MTFAEFCIALEKKIEDGFDGVTQSDAERLSLEFISAMMKASDQLKICSLDARMRKSGVKAIRAAVYADILSKSDKKPTEGSLEHSINSHELVLSEQKALDEAECEKENLQRYYETFLQAQITFRGISKGSMG